MSNRLRFLAVLLGGLIVAAIYTFPLWQPFMTTAPVGTTPAWVSQDLRPVFQGLPIEQQTAFNAMASENQALAVAMLAAVAQPDVTVPAADQAMPPMEAATIVSQGSFTEINALHGASGTATIYQMPDDRRILRFEDFRSSRGPNLHVILARSPNPLTAVDVGTDYVDLGPLVGNVGDQNYAVPAQIDLSQYQSVVIYCLEFGVVFSVAELT